MLIMFTPDGADAMHVELKGGQKGGGMRPWHFDLVLKEFLAPAKNNELAKACYVFLPIGNYTTHISGCDTKHFGEGTTGRPNCWREAWACPRTTLDEDPQRRPKRFLCWNGDSKYFDVGSADVGFVTGGTLEWRSFWTGNTPHPALRDEEQRRLQRTVKNRLAGKGPAGIEPAAIPDGAADDTEGKGKEVPCLPRVTCCEKEAGPRARAKRLPFRFGQIAFALASPRLTTIPSPVGRTMTMMPTRRM